MQNLTGEEKNIITIRKKKRIATDLDFLVSLLHARYSKMAKGERLFELTRLQDARDFFQSIFPDKNIENKVDFQKACIFGFINEIYELYPYLSEKHIYLIDWIVKRFEIENIKLLVRGFLTKTPSYKIRDYLINFSGEPSLDIKKILELESIEDFIRIFPKGFLQDNLKTAFKIYGDKPKPFFIEAFIDSMYYKELISRVSAINENEKNYIKPIIQQEIDIFHLMLITRGRMNFNLPVEELKTFHVEGTNITKRIFKALLEEPDKAVLLKILERKVIDTIPPEFIKIEQTAPIDTSILENLAWKRFYRICLNAFYESHMNFGAVMGYIGLKRIETANLITLSEGIDLGFGTESIRKHLILKDLHEVVHV